MSSTFFVTLSIPLLAYIGMGTYLYAFQRDYIYFPTPEATISDTQSIKIKNNGESIKVWVLNAEKPQAIIYFGGNAEATEYNIADFKSVFNNYSVYIVNYRGFGGSTGTASEQALYDDALALYDQLKNKHSVISVIGRSLGSGVATYLSTKRQIEKLILITPYDSIASIAQKTYPWYPVSIMLKDKYDSLSRAKSIDSQTLIIIAENDQIIPPRHSHSLASAFRTEQITVEVIKDASHNSISMQPQYLKLLKSFMN